MGRRVKREQVNRKRAEGAEGWWRENVMRNTRVCCRCVLKTNVFYFKQVSAQGHGDVYTGAIRIALVQRRVGGWRNRGVMSVTNSFSAPLLVSRSTMHSSSS